MNRKAAGIGVSLLIFAAYLITALIITYPLITVLPTHYAGHPFGDSYEYARHSWWITHALQTGQPLFEDPLLAYPDGLSGWYLWTIPLQSFPTWLFAFVLPLPLAFNLSLLLTLALNGWSMCWLIRRLTRNLPAALIAGLIFLAYPTFQGHLAAGHIGLLTLWPVPFFVYGIISITQSGDASQGALGIGARLNPASMRRTLLITALWFSVSLWGSVLIGLYLLLPITTVFTLRTLLLRDWRAFTWLFASVALGAALAAVFMLPFLLETANNPTPLTAARSTTLLYSADLLTVVAPSFQNPLFSSWAYPRTLLGAEPFERAGYIGLAAAVLSAVGLWRARGARIWGMIALIAWVLSLGPLLHVNGAPVLIRSGDYVSGVPLPYALIETLPLFSSTRTPARFNFAVGFAVAMMAGCGTAWLMCKLPRKGRGQAALPLRVLLLSIVLYGVILFEYQLFWSLPVNRGVVPAPIAALATRSEVRAVFNIPALHPLTDKDALWLQTGHQRPIIAGHIARETPVNPAKLTLLETLDLALLNHEGVDVVILHKQWADAEGVLEALARENLGEPFYEDEYIAAFEVPTLTAAPQPIILHNPPTTITAAYDAIYFYTPNAQAFQLRLAGSGALTLSLNGLTIEHLTLQSGEMRVVSLLAQSGYHRLTVAPQTACPSPLVEMLICPAVTLEMIEIE